MLQILISQIPRIIDKRPYCKEALALYGELIHLMEDMEGVHRPIEVEDSMKELKRREGFPLFSRGDLPLDFGRASKHLNRFFDHLRNKGREDRDGLEKASKALTRDSDWARRLFKAMLEENGRELSKVAREVDLNPRTLQFLTTLALKPSLFALRQSLSEEIEKTEWDYGYCPFCGSQPNMAYFDNVGKRFLHCELCNEEWSYPRINCPFCQNEDQKSLGYFYSDQEKGFRVDFCRGCQRYIKTIDKRIFEEAGPMELEYLATIHLDLLANENGFK